MKLYFFYRNNSDAIGIFSYNWALVSQYRYHDKRITNRPWTTCQLFGYYLVIEMRHDRFTMCEGEVEQRVRSILTKRSMSMVFMIVRSRDDKGLQLGFHCLLHISMSLPLPSKRVTLRRQIYEIRPKEYLYVSQYIFRPRNAHFEYLR